MVINTDKKVALVSGASSGIGLAVVAMLATSGYRVFGTARSEERLTQSFGELEGDVIGVPGDVTSQEDISRLVGKVMDQAGRIDVLINNAGTNGGGELADITDEAWDAVMETNLTSVFRLTREVMRAGNLKRPGSRLINIASTAGKQGVIYATPYCASKHAVIGFTRALALELAPHNVTVNAVCPGYVETPMAQKVRQGYAERWGVSEADVLSRFNAKIPMGRYSTPREVAAMVTFLASEDAGTITGQAINVCGGLGRF